MAHSGRISHRKEKAIAALLTQPTVHQAAEAAGIGTRTLFRWLGDPCFQDEYRAARRQAVGAAIGRLQQLSSDAVGALSSVMLDPEASPASRVSAARTILELSIKAVELEELEARLVAIEQSLGVSR